MVTAYTIRNYEEAARKSGLQQEENASGTVNVGETERTVSKLGGGVLIGAGLLKGGFKGLLMAGLGGVLLYRGKTGHCSLYEALGAHSLESYEPGRFDSVSAQHGVRVEEAVTINRSPEEVYKFWRDHKNLPRFMGMIESVTSTDGIHSHWVAAGPMGVTLEWDAEIYNETPNEMIAWRSLDGSQIDTAGSVHFRPAPGGRGTEVHVNQKFDPPGGQAALLLAKLFRQDPETQTREDLRRLKQILEAGEVATVKGQPAGRA